MTPGDDQRDDATQRLDAQLRWYATRSAENKRWFHRLKVAQIVIAAAIPVVAAGLREEPMIVGALGALIVVLEGLQQLFQFQQNWATYRATAEALKHEKYLYLARAAHYGTIARPDALLAERVEGLVSQEHALWVSERRDAVAAAGA